MNNLWIEDSHYEAKRCLEQPGYRVDDLDRFDYLDMIGLFETCWIIYDFDDFTNSDRIMSGYPQHE